MKKKINFKEIFATKRPNSWEDIPDIDLYMDQVISYMKRQHLGLELKESLTPAMVNNYIKQKLLPRASGKKYNKEHIAYLTAICLIKQIVSVSETKSLIDLHLENESIEDFYSNYTTLLDSELLKVYKEMEKKEEKKEIADLALQLAVSSYAQKLACECLLDTISEDEIDK